MISVNVGIMDTEVIKSLAARVKDNLTTPDTLPNLELIRCAANLAHRGLLDDVNSLLLCDKWNVGDLSTVPTKHLASLASRVKGIVHIDEVTGCDLVTIFDSLNCQELSITSQRLGREETKALWRAMKTSRVQKVSLYDVDELDVEALPEFPELGRNIHFVCGSSTEVKYARELRRWAHREGLCYVISNEEGDFRNDDFEDEDNEQDKDKIGKVYKIISIWSIRN